MPHLALTLLGSFQIVLDGTPVTTFDSNKVRALLVYLAVEANRPHRRETLAGLLWPDTPEASARRSLSQALFNLRQALGDPQADPPFLLISREAIQFNPAGDYSLDVAIFKRAVAAYEQHPHPRPDPCPVCVPYLQQAEEQYRGDFLPGFFLEDSAAFEEWALLQRESLRRQAGAALAHLAGYYEQQADYAAALRICGRQLELDPWQEEAHRQMMRVLALNGQRSAALAQYETCRRVLAAELGVEPAAETRALYEAIKAGDPLSEPPTGEIPPPRSRPPVPLPTPLTPFVGRERELAELSRLLAEPDCRLLTLVGPGGMGKTRLALQVASHRQQTFAHGAAFVSLASISDSQLVIPAIAGALGFTFYGPADLQSQLLNYLRQKELLLVLDNFEQLLLPSTKEAAEGSERGQSSFILREILQQAPQVKLLVTSREQLQLQGEWVFEVEGLGQHGVELFRQSARRARAGFELGERDYPLVERICRLVGDMPLAIELAASWVRTLSYPEIAQEIERNLDFLATATQDVPERHRSIRATFDHSWKLLSPEEQRGLQALSLFRGGFRREAAEQVAGVSLGLLSALISKSLVRPAEANVGRYELHELIRQYAAARLAGDPEENIAAHDRHSRYYAAWLESRSAALRGADQPATLAEINAEIDNIRAAWAWAVRQTRVEEINRATTALFWYYELRNWFQEGKTLFGQAVQALQAQAQAELLVDHTLALGQALNYQGFFCLRLGQYGQAGALLSQSLTRLRSLAPTPAVQAALATSLTFLGIVKYRSGDYAEGRQHLRESLALNQALGNRFGIGISLRHLGLVMHALGDYAEAYHFLSESLRISRESGNRWAIAFSLNFLSRTAYVQGAYQEARQLLQEGLALSQALEDRYNMALALSGLGLVSQSQGKTLEAQGFFQESAAILREIDERGTLADTLNNLGKNLLALGDRPEARRCFLEALVMARQVQVTPAALEALLGLATWQAQEGPPEPALKLLALILQHPAANRETKDQAQKLYLELAPHLSPVQLAAIQSQAGDFETVVAEFAKLGSEN